MGNYLSSQRSTAHRDLDAHSSPSTPHNPNPSPPQSSLHSSPSSSLPSPRVHISSSSTDHSTHHPGGFSINRTPTPTPIPQDIYPPAAAATATATDILTSSPSFSSSVVAHDSSTDRSSSVAAMSRHRRADTMSGYTPRAPHTRPSHPRHPRHHRSRTEIYPTGNRQFSLYLLLLFLTPRSLPFTLCDTDVLT